MKPPFHFPHRQKQQGMVLLELVAALTIFTLVAFSMVMVLNAAFDAAKERNEIDAATRGLENQIALLHASRLVPLDQDLPDDGSGIGYHVVIAPEQFQDQKKQPVTGIYRATITAKWKSNGHEEDRDVSELLYQP